MTFSTQTFPIKTKMNLPSTWHRPLSRLSTSLTILHLWEKAKSQHIKKEAHVPCWGWCSWLT